MIPHFEADGFTPYSLAATGLWFKWNNEDEYSIANTI